MRVLRCAGAVMAAGFFFFTLGSRGTGADAPPVTLRIGITTEPNTLEPNVGTQVIEGFVATFLYSGLLDAHPDGTIEPRLATVVPTRANGGISSDLRTITFHLRDDVQWHDGTPFTSADVAFTQRALTNPANNVGDRDIAALVQRLDTPDAHTVVVHLAHPFAPFMAEWAQFAILPEHLLASAPSINDVPFNAAPVGLGPFVFEHWTRGSEIALRANPRYYRGRPKIDRIVLRLEGDENTAAIDMRTHALDAVAYPSAALLDAVGADGVRRWRVAQNTTFGMTMNVTRRPLDDRRVRRALADALDRTALARTVGGVLATATAGDIPASMTAYDPHIPVEPARPARARAALRAAGWTFGADGIAQKAGHRLTLQMLYANKLLSTTRAAVLIQSMLRTAGADVALKAEPLNVLYAPPPSRTSVWSGNFDLVLGSFTLFPDPDDTRHFGCANRAPAGYNFGRYCNPRFDRLSARALATVDANARRALYARIEHLLLDDAPEAFIWSQDSGFVTVAGVDHIVDDHHDFTDPAIWTK